MPPAPTSFPPTLGSTPSHDQKSRRGQGKMATGAPDGLWLDFLYPPQTLAWLHRANGQPWERWEKRNARRLPEGFIHAPRGYASRSYTRPARYQNQDAGIVGQQDTNCSSQTPSGRRPYAKSTRSSIDLSEFQGAGKESQNYGGSDRGSTPSSDVLFRPTGQASTTQPLDFPGSSADPGEHNDTHDFADSPSDLAEPLPPQDPTQHLRTLMSRKTKLTTQDETSRAWDLYTDLHRDDRGDTKLARELIVWLAGNHNPSADAHCVSLFESLPVPARTLEAYKAALAILLRTGAVESALALHVEAMRNIPNGNEISRFLFRHAVEQRLWPLALQCQKAHHEEFTTAAQRRLFWLNVADIPDLLNHTAHLVSYMRMPRHSTDAHSSSDPARSKEYRNLSRQLSAEAVNHHLGSSQPADNKNQWRYTLRKLRLLVDEVRRSHGDGPGFLLKTMMSILRNYDPKGYYSVHNIVCFLYKSYHAMQTTQPPEELFALLIPHLLHFEGGQHSVRRYRRNVTVDMVIEDYKLSFGKLGRTIVHKLMSFYALHGNVEKTAHFWGYLQTEYPAYSDQRAAMHSTVYVHARRADVRKALDAFAVARDLAQQNNDDLDVKVWNSLLHAHQRADDVDGAIETFKKLLSAPSTTPTARSFHAISELLAGRGDVEGVEDLLTQYDSLTARPRTTALLGSLMTALVNDGEVGRAESALRSAIPQVRAGKMLGSLTGSFNIFLTAHALRRDIGATMNAYQWMKDEHIRMDQNTYGTLVQALVLYRKTDAAWQIVRDVMRDEGVPPTAFHFSIVMAGYVRQRLPYKALKVHEVMQARNIPETLSSRRAYLQAKGRREDHVKSLAKPWDSFAPPQDEFAPLSEVIAELYRIVQASDGSESTRKQPSFGNDAMGDFGPASSVYFDSIVHMHGQRKCMDAVREIFNYYRAQANDAGYTSQHLPMRLLTALMVARYRAGQFRDVEALWQLAEAQAGMVAPRKAIPQFGRAEERQRSTPVETLEEDIDGSPFPQEVDFAETGFDAGVKQAAKAAPQPEADAEPSLVSSISPRRRHILSRPLLWYIMALSAEGRIRDVLSTVVRVLREGYFLDNATWNRFIRLLCEASPPLILLAFVMTERFLVRHFPGWATFTQYPSPQARVEGLQYIRARYMRADELMPQYATLVRLGAALLDLRRLEAMGGAASQMSGSMGKFVGSLREIRARAPRTLFAVQSMPTVADGLQTKLLGRGL